ncbi:DEAD/DEAH box helicase [Saccharothrix longispora]|uniref:DEAD/DEAH box helicase n=1 Tax=Saccharothrix longispora TaxID=33920 RepID=UPI00286B1DA5|nr:DEAD/DEAH box helicase [Saccharothrix longispora]
MAGTSVRGQARKLLGQVDRLVEAGTAHSERVDHLRRIGQAQVSRLVDAEVYARLAARPVTDLRGRVDERTKLKALVDAGYKTVAELLAHDTSTLREHHGVGPHTAQQAAEAARELADEVRRGVRIRFDPKRPDPDYTELLCVIAALRQAVATRSAVQVRSQRFSERVASVARAAAPARSWWRMALTWGSRRHRVLDAVLDLDGVLTSSEVSGFRVELEALGQATTPAVHASTVWDSYSRDAAGFNALLASLGGRGDLDEHEGAQGFLPQAARHEVGAVDLNTTGMKTALFGYQAFGARFVILRGKCILGDEMGLGKTVQALAAMVHLAAVKPHRFLVVCPLTLLGNWLQEIVKHTDLTAYSLHGPGRPAATQAWRRTGGVAVVTYDTVRTLKDLKPLAADMLVVDEAHRVKNPDARQTEQVRVLAEGTERVLLLTGTPMENTVSEFRVLVEHLDKGLAARLAIGGSSPDAEEFRRRVAPVYLRRNVEDVLTELPNKIEIDDWVLSSPQDADAYRTAVATKDAMAMRQATFGPRSEKLKRLMEIVDEARDDGRKVIVFSYFHRVLDIASAALGDGVVGRLDGNTPAARRQGLIDAFTGKTGHAVLLAQIETGGEGLNIQAASVVVITEPQWRPSKEDQAVARAYRMGQVGVVQVHRLLAKDTIDQRIREKQAQKIEAFDRYARPSDTKDADPRAIDPQEQGEMIQAEYRRLGL